MPHPFRVLFVDHESRLSGGQQDLLDLVEGLAPHDVEVHAALPVDGPLAERLHGAGATIHPLPMGDGLRHLSRWKLVRRPHLIVKHLAAFLVATWRLWRIVRTVRPHAVHTNSMKAHLIAIAPAKAARAALLWHVRDILDDGWVRRAFTAVARRVPDRIVCLSRATGDQFTGCKARAKVRVVYNGIRLERIERGDGAAMRERIGAGEGDVLVGIVGQIIHWKGQDVFVDAASKVAPFTPSARFVIIGDVLFPENDNGYAASVRERVATHGLDDRLTWAGWVDDMPAAFAALDVLVHASRTPEPFGRVIVEAMAAGVPVIASTAGAGREIVPPDAGRLVPPDDAGALAGALDELINDPLERARAGAAARRGAKRFDISRTVEGVLAVYREVRP